MDKRSGGTLRKRRGERLPPAPPPSFPTSGKESEAAARASALKQAPSARADDAIAAIRTTQVDECLRQASLRPLSDGETEESVHSDGLVSAAEQESCEDEDSEAGLEDGEPGDAEVAAEQESCEDEDGEAVAIPVEFRQWPRFFSNAEEETDLTDAERIEAYADIRGLHHPLAFASSPEDSRRLAALRGALEKIPAKEKGAFLAARAENPLLLETSPHLKLWIGESDFDPDRAARRVAQYWERRQAVFGRAAFLSGSVAAPSDADFLRLYREWRTEDDPDAWQRANGAVALSLSHWVRSKVASMNEEIDKMPPNKKESLAEAWAWNFNSSGQTDPAPMLDVQVLFLQSVDFQVSLAAQKMVQYSEVKSDLLGPGQQHGNNDFDNGDLFASGFTLESLSEEHQAEMDLGLIRVLPSLDSAGRVICFFDPERLASGRYSRQRLSRFVWYVFHMAIESRSCRVNGIVVVVNLRGVSPKHFDRKLVAAIFRMLRSLPAVTKAVHHCFEVVPWWFQTFVYPLVNFIMGRKIGARYLVHSGREETLRSFEACGIARDMLPAELGGSAGSDSWEAALQERMDVGL